MLRGVAGTESVGAKVAIFSSAGNQVAVPEAEVRTPDDGDRRAATGTRARADRRPRHRSRAKPIAPVVVRASSRCPGGSTFRGPVVARGIRVQRNGRWTARITLSPSLCGSRVFLRAETQVRKTTRNPKRFRTFSLIQGIALKQGTVESASRRDGGTEGRRDGGTDRGQRFGLSVHPRQRRPTLKQGRSQ